MNRSSIFVCSFDHLLDPYGLFTEPAVIDRQILVDGEMREDIRERHSFAGISRDKHSQGAITDI